MQSHLSKNNGVGVVQGKDMLDFESILHNDLLKTLFENSYNSIAITDAQLDLPGPKFLYVNPAFTNKTGYTMDDLKDQTPRILQGEETNKEILKELKDKCRKGEFFHGSTVNYRKDGTKYHVEWNISPIKDEKGNITHYISMQRDVTAEVEYKEVLEEKIEQQTRLAMMGEMIDSIAHQWKQPLNIINMYSELLIYAYEDKKLDLTYIEEYQDKVKNQVKHMNDTLNEFRDFLRPNKSKKYFKISVLLESIKVLLKDELNKYNIKLISKIKNDLELYGIENEFKHVIINLINNSKDAFLQNNIQNREIKIEVSSVNNGELIYMDNAGGIPQGILERIFDMNFTTKEQLNGSGIGLYMSKKILNKHGAKIYVESKDSNTTFIIHELL